MGNGIRDVAALIPPDTEAIWIEGVDADSLRVAFAEF